MSLARRVKIVHFLEAVRLLQERTGTVPFLLGVATAGAAIATMLCILMLFSPLIEHLHNTKWCEQNAPWAMPLED